MNELLSLNMSIEGIVNILVFSSVAIVLGFVLAKVHCYKNKTSKNFAMSLAILPLTIQLIILLVNGNVGTGVAVMGAFSLVKFRSMPGTSKEIGSIFATMAVGLAVGTGQIIIAIIFTIIYCGIVLCYEFTELWGGNSLGYHKLKITIPEDLYVPNVFNVVLSKYTLSYELVSVKTTNMGSLFQLEYKIVFNEGESLKQFLNELRCRNGNLDINYNLIIDDKNGL